MNERRDARSPKVASLPFIKAKIAGLDGILGIVYYIHRNYPHRLAPYEYETHS